MAMPFSAEPRASVEPASSPSSISEQISAGPNFSAARTSSGAKKIIITMPNEAPKKAASIVMPSAVPPLPCWSADSRRGRSPRAADGTAG